MTLFQSIKHQFCDSEASGNAVNLARRMTRSNEPDLLQENLYEDDNDDMFSHAFCKMVASKVHSESEFPMECREYTDAVLILKRHNSLKSETYAGMSPGDAIDAMRAKDEGHLNSAQIKRRMTTRKNGRFY
ncbi:predicted protein [Thalassiosira pseudonana CCMP1335]|uniref:Uncharacterized protein n=1 Tax=Thalassiosira pseudonana TaxID=35128 RepID=B5YLU2_THAPS|nr:predicted protein [Thalassiosira pseudonana CCMP1335]ACI64294.1 predicted protein [Thalassiosira pseudonana CCMP1335]|eukprot:g5000.t1 g5000   contig18:414695-415176(-)